MATHPYPPQHYNYSSLDDSYKHYQWGVTYETLPHYSPHLDTLQYLSHDRGNDELPVTHIDYSQVSTMQQNFKKLKVNQLQVLKQLRREYEVLKNTDLGAGKSNKNKNESESIQSNDSASRSRFSQARSSSNSHRQNKSRMKSHQKEILIANLQKKQLQVIVSNSMRKIQQLLKEEIQLKKTVSDLKGKLEISAAAQSENTKIHKKHSQEIQCFKKMLEQRKAECQTFRQKSRASSQKIQMFERNEQRERFQLKCKQERIIALEQEIYLQKSKVTNLQLDIKKHILDFELIESKYQNQINLLQKKLIEPSIIVIQKNQEINRLKYQLELKDQRYKILFSQAEKQQKESTTAQSKQYIKALESLITTFKDEKQQKANSQQVIALLIQKLHEGQQIENQQSILSSEVSLLRRQLNQLRNNPSKSQQSHLLERIKHLEKTIQDENVQKFYFFQDLKKLQNQLGQERKCKQESLRQVRELKVALRKVEQQARLYSYQLETIRNHNIDLTQSQHQNKSLTQKNQQTHQKQLQIIQLKAQYEDKYSHHKKQIIQYEQQLKFLKRQLAEQEIKVYRTKEELELKLSLAKTQYQAQINRLQESLQREKKAHANQLNEKVNLNIGIQSKLVQKSKEVQQISQQLSNLLKQRESLLQALRTEHQQKLKNLQERYNAEIKGLAQKLENLAVLNEKHGQVLSRNASLQHEIIETKRFIRLNRQISEGVDHLWKVKEAEYSNINQILNSMNDF